MPKPIAELLLGAGTYIEHVDGAETVQQTFDEYLARAAAQPSDIEAFEGLRNLMVAAVGSGEVDFVMHNAMLLAATACMDPHLEELANEAGSLVDSIHSNSSSDGHGHRTATKSHKIEASCTNNKKSKKQAARSLSDLIFNFKLPRKSKLLSFDT